MQLSKYMEAHGLKDEDMVARLKRRGIRVDRSHISKIRRRKNWPGMRLAAAIRDITKGQVTLDEQIPRGVGE